MLFPSWNCYHLVVLHKLLQMSEAIKKLLYASDKNELEVEEAQDHRGQSVDVECSSDGDIIKEY